MVGRPSKYITRTQIGGTFDKNIITHLFTFTLIILELILKGEIFNTMYYSE
ncbi:hypothetical protein SAMN03080594_104375 [Arenibacter palladensis]|uniref:Uncharacterized protein n=1 Tax=Arenibacter palladensis TaxID=237373 RepID=A0A1M5C4M1_9FLAO|nr:hypothetical protein SAMN03080594_104375 [Arenibacter palladensis]